MQPQIYIIKIINPIKNIMEYEFEKYAVSINDIGWDNIGDAVKNKVDQFGVAVIPNILNEDECQ